MFENTIGDIVWSRSVTGLYAGELNGAFNTEKTFCVAQSYDQHRYIQFATDINSVNFGIYDQLTDLLTDNNIWQIEIRVYP